MTEIQQTNIAVANFIIGELYKDKPFNLKLDAGQTGALYNITSESHHLHSGFVRKLEATLRQRVNNGTGVILEINSNADMYYHVLSSYIAEHTQQKTTLISSSQVVNLIRLLIVCSVGLMMLLMQ